MPKNIRRGRLDVEMTRVISEIIATKLRDPALPQIISVMGVDVTQDMRYAKVRISVLGEPEVLQRTVEALNHAAGFIRRELGARIRIRYTPELLFEADASILHSIKVAETIRKIHSDTQGEGHV